MPSIEELADRQRAIVDAWWQAMPRGGWVQTHLIWAQVVNATSRDLVIVREDGSDAFLAFPDDVSDLIARYREALADPRGGWPIGFEMRMDAQGSAQMRIIWNDRVWFGVHPGAPLQPNPDPTIGEVPTAEMWRLELERHPRADDAVPDWWRALIDVADENPPAPATDHVESAGTAMSALPLAVSDLDGAIGSRVVLPAAHRVMAGAWGWDVVYRQANDAVIAEMEALDDTEATAIFNAPGDERDEIIEQIMRDAALRLRRELEAEWLAGTPIRLLREWNERHGARDPQGLGEVDPTVPFRDAVTTSLPLKQVGDALAEQLDEVVARNVRDRFFGVGA